MSTTSMEFTRSSRRETKRNSWEEIVAVAGGGALAVAGLLRKSAAGAAMAAAGGFLIYRSVSSDRPLTGLVPGRFAARPVRAHVALTIGKPAEELYTFFRQFGNLPRFMRHLESVSSNGARSHWVACAPLGRHVEWDAEITEETANELIAWRSLEDASVPNWGRVRFQPAPGNRGTEVHVELEYLPPGGEVGRVFAKLLGEEPELQIYQDMHRFKQLMETGEIATTEGQPSGRRSALARAASRLSTEAARDREMQRAG